MPAYLNKKTKKWDLSFSVFGKSHMVRGFDSKEEALDNELFMKETLTANRGSRISKVRFSTVCKVTFDEKISYQAQSTQRTKYYRFKNYIVPGFPDMEKEYRLLTFDDFMAWFKYVDSSSIVEKENVRELLTQIVDYGHKRFGVDLHRHLLMLPEFHRTIRIPKNKVVYTFSDFLRLRDFIDDQMAYLIVTVFYMMGIRTSELRGLVWDHGVNLEKKELILYQGVTNKTMASGQMVVPLKSKKSYRSIPIPTYLVGLFNEWRLVSPCKKTGQFVFPSKYNCKKVIGETYIKRTIDSASIAAGLPQIDKHELRHSFATTLEGLGYSSETIRGLLGHSSKSITETVYLHSSRDIKSQAINDLARLLQDWEKKKVCT